jgi:hypothetical protein
MPEHKGKIVPDLALLAQLEKSSLARLRVHEVYDEIVDLFVLGSGLELSLSSGNRGRLGRMAEQELSSTATPTRDARSGSRSLSSLERHSPRIARRRLGRRHAIEGVEQFLLRVWLLRWDRRGRKRVERRVGALGRNLGRHEIDLIVIHYVAAGCVVLCLEEKKRRRSGMFSGSRRKGERCVQSEGAGSWQERGRLGSFCTARASREEQERTCLAIGSSQIP